MAEHRFRKAGVEGSNPSFGFQPEMSEKPREDGAFSLTRLLRLGVPIDHP